MTKQSLDNSQQILIVEDSAVEAELLRRCLDRAGYTVSMATNGAEALQAARSQRPALVISDINMPEMNGYELCHAIKYDAVLWSVPVILLTMLSETKDILLAINSGADGYVTKPFIEANLLGRIRHLLATPLRRKPAEERRSEEVEYDGERYTLSGGSQHILNLLLSVYQTSLSQNRDLTRVESQLSLLNDGLEDQVRERTEAERESEERYRVLMDTAGEAIICIRAPDSITLWNKKAEALFGYSAAEAMGKGLHQLIAPEKYRAEADAGLKAFYQTGEGPIVGQSREMVALRRDGSEFPIELSISAMQIKGEWQATGIISDLSERKRLHEEVEAARQREREARELASMERISGGASSSITAQAYGVQRLRDGAPEFFATLAQGFARLLDMALEQRVLRVDHPISEQLRAMAEKLGAVKAGPRDAIDIYVQALNMQSRDVPAEKAQAYAEEGRILVLELMGNLVSFYRKHFSGGLRHAASQANSIDKENTQ